MWLVADMVSLCRSCVWEPHDSAAGPGKLYLALEIEGTPPIEAFADGWDTLAHKIWKELQPHFSFQQVFTKQREIQWKKFIDSLPWNGIRDREGMAPPFDLEANHVESPIQEQPREIQEMMAGVGEDQHGHPRLNYQNGRDMLQYPRAVSFVSYNDVKLDGSKRQPKKRTRPSKTRIALLAREWTMGPPHFYSVLLYVLL